MRLVVVIAAPAVGKATVGRALADGYGFRLFHNHVSLDAVASVFEWGTPPFQRLVGEFRARVVEEAAASGVDLVFTYGWSFPDPYLRIDTSKVEPHAAAEAIAHAFGFEPVARR